MSLPVLLDRILNDPLRVVGLGRRAVGYLGWDVPVELILAAGAEPVHLGELAVDDTALADRFLENSFSAQSRAVAQRWLSGDLDSLEAVVFSRSDDSAQRLYYYLCELQRMGECKGPTPLLYDLARIGRATSIAHTIESTRSLGMALGVDEQRLVGAIQRVADRSALLDELAKLRTADSVPPGSLANRISRAARSDWSEEFDVSLREWLGRPETVQPRKRMLLVGSVPMDERLHNAIEVNGVAVVGEINEARPSDQTRHEDQQSSNADATAGRRLSYGEAMLKSGDSPAGAIERVAHRCHRQTTAAMALLQSPAEIVKAARALRVDGVIVWMLATDTGLAWEAPRIERALREAKLPTLMLTSQPQSLSADALAQIEQFRHTLEAP